MAGAMGMSDLRITCTECEWAETYNVTQTYPHYCPECGDTTTGGVDTKDDTTPDRNAGTWG